ncbi:MAG TPA: mechanosensitive ion channel family protein [Parafilimonas sp.]|nr:mechanosensitive ion channel family protein [Parafilimonas sp.]
MKTLRLPIISCLIFIGHIQLHAQQQPKAIDSMITDSTQEVTAAYLLQQEQEEKVDSIIATQIQTELKEVSTDQRRREELEKKLKELSARDSLRKAEQLAQIRKLKATATGYPVTLLADTLFFIYIRVGAFSASFRAKAISGRIAKLYDDAFFKPDSMNIVNNGATYDIMYKTDNIIMSVTDIDALWYNKKPSELATEYLDKIKNTVVALRAENSVVNWLKRIGYVCVILFGIWIIVYAINRLFNYMAKLLLRRKSKYFSGITINNVNILPPEQHYLFAKRMNNLLRLAFIILALYLALPLLFSVFPQTKGFADVLINWILTPVKSILNNVLDFMPNFFTIAVIYIITLYLLKVIRYFAVEINRGLINIKGFYSDWAMPTYNIARVLIYAFMFVVIFPYLPGSHSPAFQGVTVFLGLLVSLGSSSAIANIVAGLVITYMRPFKKGDRVKIGDVTGDVVEKTLLVTRLRTIKNEDITVPNSTVLSNHTINYSTNTGNEGLIIHTTVTIGYDVPWKDMHQALTDAALRTDAILKEPQPFVLQTSLEDFYVSYQLNAYTREATKQAVIYSDLHKHIQDVCNERGIEIMSPHYNAVRDGNQTSIPQDYLSKDYKAPSFNVNVSSNKSADENEDRKTGSPEVSKEKNS